ncbi:chaplin [Nonomuraea terrae]|uniref:Chaplin n=1 Tax=Nonomuraea terrae TaxID=2530383 RepID=A0A4R4YTV1_9ACTN|nr:chaplin [Nonomuraea terrae]TDD47042.1 chaplin [Nonomuraea terrae]
MRTWAKASTPAALLAVAVMSFGGSSTALADTSGDGSIGGGNQVNLPISLPIDISGNSIAAVGSSEASSQGGAEVVNPGGSGSGGNRTSGDGSVLGGNQINAPISIPVNACGNAVSLIGKSDAGCKGGASVRHQGKGGGSGGNRTSGDGSVLGGNQIIAPITAPLNACGNSVAIFGDATAGCKGGATVKQSGDGGGAGGNRTSGRGSVLGGNQVVAPITAPVNVCGNAVALVGRAFAGCTGGSKVGDGGHKHHYHARHKAPRSAGNDTDGRFGAGSGNQVIAPISLPIDACGNSVGNAIAGCSGGATVHQSGSGGAGGNRTSGAGGVLSGNQVVAPITAPVNVCGNAVALIGRAFAGCKGGATVKQSGSGGAGGNRTSGAGGVLSGNQLIAPITAPINVCGNAAAVLGDAAAGCLGGANVGKAGYGGHGAPSPRFVRSNAKVADAKGGLVPVAGLPGMQGDDLPVGVAQLPVVGDVSQTLGLPALPGLPGMPSQPVMPQQPQLPKKAAPAKPKKHAHAAPVESKGAAAVSALEPATRLLASTPAGGVVTSTTRTLPVGDLGLMSAEQPAGVTGMNSGSLLALVAGAMLAASATLFASARRFRFGRK